MCHALNAPCFPLHLPEKVSKPQKRGEPIKWVPFNRIHVLFEIKAIFFPQEVLTYHEVLTLADTDPDISRCHRIAVE